ncbi:MAG: DUF4389 domain-containing protein [Thiovulaceae bacterium]|nr:DUF4389 domain-containing protein [Sulfurimonadaceae bacterium]
MDPELKTNLLNYETYKRFALMLVFVIIYSIVELIIYATAIFQIIHLLITGKMHTVLKNFAKGISAYLYDIVKFLTFDTETLPFPFKSWDYGDKELTVKKTSRKTTKKAPKKADDDSEDEMHA